MRHLLINLTKKKAVILTAFISLICVGSIHADGFHSTSYFLDKQPSKKLIYETSSEVPTGRTTYVPLSSTIYRPFASSMQEKSESKFLELNVGTTTFGLISPSDPLPPEEEINDGPVGEAWCLLVFAAIAAVVVFVKQRKQIVIEK